MARSAGPGREIGYSEFAPRFRRRQPTRDPRRILAAHADCPVRGPAAPAPPACPEPAARRRPRRPRARRRARAGAPARARHRRPGGRPDPPGRIGGQHGPLAGPPRRPRHPRLRRRARRSRAGPRRRAPGRRGRRAGGAAGRRPDRPDRHARGRRRGAQLRRRPGRGRPPGAGRRAPCLVRRRRRPPPAGLLAPRLAPRRRGAPGDRPGPGRRGRGVRRPRLGGTPPRRGPARGAPADRRCRTGRPVHDGGRSLGVPRRARAGRAPSLRPGRRRQAGCRRRDAARPSRPRPGRADRDRDAAARRRRHDRRRRRLRRRVPGGLAGARPVDRARRPPAGRDGRPPRRRPAGRHAASRAGPAGSAMAELTADARAAVFARVRGGRHRARGGPRPRGRAVALRPGGLRPGLPALVRQQPAARRGAARRRRRSRTSSAAADALMEPRGLAHRRIDNLDPADDVRLRPGFEAAGWRREDSTWMVAVRPPDRPAAPGLAREVSWGELRATVETSTAREPYATDPEVVRQLVDRMERLQAAATVRHFAVPSPRTGRGSPPTATSSSAPPRGVPGGGGRDPRGVAEPGLRPGGRARRRGRRRAKPAPTAPGSTPTRRTGRRSCTGSSASTRSGRPSPGPAGDERAASAPARLVAHRLDPGRVTGHRRPAGGRRRRRGDRRCQDRCLEGRLPRHRPRPGARRPRPRRRDRNLAGAAPGPGRRPDERGRAGRAARTAAPGRLRHRGPGARRRRGRPRRDLGDRRRPVAQGRGVGRALMDAAVGALASARVRRGDPLGLRGERGRLAASTSTSAGSRTAHRSRTRSAGRPRWSSATGAGWARRGHVRPPHARASADPGPNLHVLSTVPRRAERRLFVIGRVAIGRRSAWR